jgi:hypothetical protein
MDTMDTHHSVRTNLLCDECLPPEAVDIGSTQAIRSQLFQGDAPVGLPIDRFENAAEPSTPQLSNNLIAIEEEDPGGQATVPAVERTNRFRGLTHDVASLLKRLSIQSREKDFDRLDRV